MDNNIPVKEIAQMLDMVAEKLPGLVANLMNTVYSEEAGSNIGKAVGAFYKQLIESGFNPEDAMAMTKDYLNSIKEMIGIGQFNQTINGNK